MLVYIVIMILMCTWMSRDVWYYRVEEKNEEVSSIRCLLKEAKGETIAVEARLARALEHSHCLEDKNKVSVILFYF